MEEVSVLEREEAREKEKRMRFMTLWIPAFMSRNHSQYWKFMTPWETTLELGAVICMQRRNRKVQQLPWLRVTDSPALDPDRCFSLVCPLCSDSGVSWSYETDHPGPLTLYPGWLTMVLREELFQQWDFSIILSVISPSRSAHGNLRICHQEYKNW